MQMDLGKVDDGPDHRFGMLSGGQQVELLEMERLPLGMEI
jgi:hypothetical protein